MKYTGPDCRQCRREGCKLYLKGARCNSENCSFDRKKSAPGQHGKGRKKQSGYSLQLREKQKAKRIYGLTEKQFLLYYRKATEMKGVTGELMLELLERRLDNVVYRLGLGASRAMSRQIVTHGHITVNGKLVNIPSYLVKKGDIIAVKEAHKESKMFDAAKKDKQLSLKSWLSFDNTTLTGTVVELPTRADIEDIEIKEHLIVELYSK
ncbi:MAG: 30S ribosomal protein S4 [Clostridia bacterium]|nr:30S ribosomal protein S4 [Clostridia bacterium]